MQQWGEILGRGSASTGESYDVGEPLCSKGGFLDVKEEILRACRGEDGA